jgi:hypothetical protein
VAGRRVPVLSLPASLAAGHTIEGRRGPPGHDLNEPDLLTWGE